MTTVNSSLRSRCKIWGGVVLTCKIIPEYMGMPLVTVVTLRNKRGVHTLVLKNTIQTPDALLERGRRIKVLGYFEFVLEIQDALTAEVLWQSAWDLTMDYIGYNAHHQCERPDDCTHWVHFYEMTQEARWLFASVNYLGGFDGFGRHYWHPSNLWGGCATWECAAELPHSIVCIETNQHVGLHLALPGLQELREAWMAHIVCNIAARSENDFQAWLKSIKQMGARNGWWRFSAEGSGNTLYDELAQLGITCDGGYNGPTK